VDFDAETITVQTVDLNVGPGPLQVTLGGFDITDKCTPDLVFPQLLTCDFSFGGMPNDGDYLLTVSTGSGKDEGDEYDLTIGAVGATGNDGNDGADGATGPAGAGGAQPYLVVNYIIATQGTFPSRNSSDPFLAEIIMFGGNFAPPGMGVLRRAVVIYLFQCRSLFASGNNLRGGWKDYFWTSRSARACFSS
jgi:hypothetical protein